MEKKKLLLVAISVGIFLVITIGAAILVFAPKNTAATGAVSYRSNTGNSGIGTAPPPSYQPPGTDANPYAPENNELLQPVSVDPVDLVRKSEDVPGLSSPPEGAARQGDSFYVNGAGQGATVISVPKPTTAAVPETAPAGRAAPAARTVSNPAPAASGSSAAASRPAPAAAKPPAASSKPAVQTKVYDDYWVQTGAFATIANAEGVKETLATKGITSIIENREVEGKTLFRVRIGPYTSQNEANYWLSLIKTINGFENSQVRMTQSRR